MKVKYKIYLAILIFFSTFIVYRHLLPFLKSQFNNQQPQVILVLGGDTDREVAGIKIAKDALLSGGSHQVVLNVANDCAVAKFLDSKILFQF